MLFSSSSLTESRGGLRFVILFLLFLVWLLLTTGFFAWSENDTWEPGEDGRNSWGCSNDALEAEPPKSVHSSGVDKAKGSLLLFETFCCCGCGCCE